MIVLTVFDPAGTSSYTITAALVPWLDELDSAAAGGSSAALGAVFAGGVKEPSTFLHTFASHPQPCLPIYATGNLFTACTHSRGAGVDGAREEQDNEVDILGDVRRDQECAGIGDVRLVRLFFVPARGNCFKPAAFVPRTQPNVLVIILILIIMLTMYV